MTITLYKNLSESIVVDKSLTEITTVEGALRDGSSIIDPTIRFDFNVDSISGANYIYIHEWNRYYFVQNITSLYNSYWLIQCHVDVLYTYRVPVRRLSAIIARQQNLYNLYLDDDKFLVNAQRLYWTKAFPNRVTAGNSANAKSFILSLAGGAGSEADK